MAAKRTPRYWLMKSEPEAFSIADLQRVGVEPWSGVRNYQARNLMRDEMSVGDLAIFYHSNATPSGAAGIAVVHHTGVVDATQFDPESPYFDPKATRAKPIWVCVDVKYKATFARLVPLAEMREHPALAAMVLLRKGSRLSVQPVTESEFAVICELGGASTRRRR